MNSTFFENIIIQRKDEDTLKANFNKPENLKRVYIETYGCQMNQSDSEIILSVLSNSGYNETKNIEESDLILLNTCSVRENAENKIFSRLQSIKKYKKNNPFRIIGILGCMAERLKDGLIKEELNVDLIVGPDEYRKLPYLIDNYLENGKKGIAVKLSKIETYDDITPVRRDGITAWISVMRGCDKFCTFCVVPFTRGRERSRKVESIVDEAMMLRDEGIKEITLLGQNVNSFRDSNMDFADLLNSVAKSVPDLRIRFITSHPYDCSKKLLDMMAKHKNICKYIHLPVQSGSERILKLMNRLYKIDEYKNVIDYARKIMPGIGLSTDIIAGFPTETETDHKYTIDLIKELKYDGAYTFAYSPRENTKAYKLRDDVPDEIKKRRLSEIIDIQRTLSNEKHQEFIGKKMNVLFESYSKKSKDFLLGRTDCNKSVIIPADGIKIGDYANVLIKRSNSATLFGELCRTC